jgi:fimbrial chaperone protein
MLRIWLKVVSAACLCAVLLGAGGAWAASFEVNPIRVSLSPATPSGLLTVRNQSSEPLRFQVSAFAWRQSPLGEMVLDPTDELIVFPTMLSLKPGEARHLRVGSTAPLGGTEKTYRIFVEELPPLQVSGAGGTIRVLTRMGIPVFRSPTGSAPDPRVEGLAVQHDQVVFALRNLGNAFFMSRKVRVRGVSAEGRTVFTRELPGWYMLAGDRRAYEDALPPEACDAARLVVEVETETTSVQAKVDLPPRACRR